MSDDYRKGDHWVVDDRTGERIRASDAVTEWTGQVVHRLDSEERHPQELVRARKDDQRPRGPVRPEETPVFGGPLTTQLAAAAEAGAQSLEVASSVRFEAGDFIKVMLDNAEAFRVLVQSVPDASHLSILTGLPFRASSGNWIVDESAVASVNIG